MTRPFTGLLPIVGTLLAATLLAGAGALAQEADWAIEQRIASSADDSEEFLSDSADDPQRWPAGYSYATSSDLELGRDATHAPQIVALRFPNLQIPAGAQIDRAVLEFTADSDQAGPVGVTIRAQDAVDSEPFTRDEDGQGSFDLSSRPSADSAQTWSPEAWTGGQAYRSPDISGILQLLVDRDDWRSGASAVFLLTPSAGGDGYRSAHAFDSNPELAPRLLVSFSGGVLGAADPAAEPGAEVAAGEAAAGVGQGESEEIEEEPVDAEPVAPEAVEAEPVGEERAEAEPAVPEPFEPEPEGRVEEPDPAQVEQPVAPEPAEPEGESVAPQPEAPAADQEEVPGGVVVEPVDPDPILPPPADAQEPSVWPGPLEEQRGEAAGGDAVARSPEAPQADAAPAEDGVVAAREAQRSRFPLTVSAGRGVRGSVLLSDYGNGVTVLTVLLDNPAPTVTYSAAIRRGECGSAGRLVADLEPIPGNRAYSTSILSLDYAELTGGDYHIAIYRSAGDFTRVSSCASLARG